MKRSSIRAASAVLATMGGVAALALPSAVAAPKAGPSLVTSPFVYKGYNWTLIASKGSLEIFAVKKSGTATQTHLYAFGSGVSFVAPATLATAKLKANLGAFGTISATFKATTKLASRTLPPPCTGKVKARTGALTGFAFTADTTFFKKVSSRSISATITNTAASPTQACGGSKPGPTPKPPAGGLSLIGTNATAGAGAILSIIASKTAAGAVTEAVTVTDDRAKTAPGTVIHSITTPASDSALTVSTDLKSATLTAAGAFLSGSLSFAAQGGYGSTQVGQLTGDYTAKFDSIGAQTPASAAPLQGTLTKS